MIAKKSNCFFGNSPTPKGCNCTNREEWQNSNEGEPKSHGGESLVWGFTLIELMAAMVLIGIISSVALIGYPRAFRKVKDSRVYSGIAQFRTQAFVLFKTDGSYADLNCAIVNNKCICPDKIIQILCEEIQTNSDQPFEIWINEDEQGFCVIAHLAGEEQFFCTDSSFNTTTTPDTPDNCKVVCENANNCACE